MSIEVESASLTPDEARGLARRLLNAADEAETVPKNGIAVAADTSKTVYAIRNARREDQGYRAEFKLLRHANGRKSEPGLWMPRTQGFFRDRTYTCLFWED